MNALYQELAERISDEVADLERIVQRTLVVGLRRLS